MSKRQLAALKLAGYRYSPTRDAWVHRAFRGRVGPVFQADGGVGLDLLAFENADFQTLFTAGSIPRMPPMDPEPLPRRLDAERRRTFPVKARLSADEPVRVVHVDGRPPDRVGIKPLHEPVQSGRVIPFKAARASA